MYYQQQSSNLSTWLFVTIVLCLVAAGGTVVATMYFTKTGFWKDKVKASKDGEKSKTT